MTHPGFKRIRGGLWLRRGDWIPVYVREQQTQPGIEYQHYAFDHTRQCICAGVTRHERMNQATANQIARVWQRWRKEYVTVFNPGRYPTAEDYLANRLPTQLCVFPIDAPQQRQWFPIEVPA